MQQSVSNTMGLPSYKNPPVVEVVVGVQFKAIDQFLCAHLGILWDSLGRKDYPECQEKLPIITPAAGEENSVVLLSKPDLPRVWFIGNTDSSIVQFQRDRIMYNWRKQEQEYPRYDTVINKFSETFDKFLSCLKSLSMDTPLIEKLELTYINFIPVSVFGGCEHVGKILKDIRWEGHRYLPAPNKFSLFWQFGIPTNSALLNTHAAMVQHLESGEEMLRIEMAVQGQAPDGDLKKCLSWFDKSRAAIVHGFTDLTTDEAHKIWGRYE